MLPPKPQAAWVQAKLEPTQDWECLTLIRFVGYGMKYLVLIVQYVFFINDFIFRDNKFCFAKLLHFFHLPSVQDSEATSAEPVVPAVPLAPVGNPAPHRPQAVSAPPAQPSVEPAPAPAVPPAAPDAETIPADLGEPNAPDVAQTASDDACSIATTIDVGPPWEPWEWKPTAPPTTKAAPSPTVPDTHLDAQDSFLATKVEPAELPKVSLGLSTVLCVSSDEEHFPADSHLTDQQLLRAKTLSLDDAHRSPEASLASPGESSQPATSGEADSAEAAKWKAQYEAALQELAALKAKNIPTPKTTPPPKPSMEANQFETPPHSKGLFTPSPVSPLAAKSKMAVAPAGPTAKPPPVQAPVGQAKAGSPSVKAPPPPAKSAPAALPSAARTPIPVPSAAPTSPATSVTVAEGLRPGEEELAEVFDMNHQEYDEKWFTLTLNHDIPSFLILYLIFSFACSIPELSRCYPAVQCG